MHRIYFIYIWDENKRSNQCASMPLFCASMPHRGIDAHFRNLFIFSENMKVETLTKIIYTWYWTIEVFSTKNGCSSFSRFLWKWVLAENARQCPGRRYICLKHFLLKCFHQTWVITENMIDIYEKSVFF